MKKLAPILIVAGLMLLAGGAVSQAAAAPSSSSRVRVINRERAAGVHPTMLAFLDYWEVNGPFDVEIGQLPGFPGGALRTAADAGGQAAACEADLSSACTIIDTPHGRGAALDLWPVGMGFNPWTPWRQQPEHIKAAFEQIGLAAERFGLEWGGRWRNEKMPDGDQPHVQMKNWRSLPFPPPNYAYSSFAGRRFGFVLRPSRRV